MHKNCFICNKEFYTKPARLKEGRGKYCSRQCYYTSKIGKIPVTHFPIGHEPWNKDLKGIHLSSLTEFPKGHTPWNKDKPFYQIREEKNNMWKGDEAGYFAIHLWVTNRLGRPQLCEHCGTTTAKKFEWANKSHEYKRDLNDWIRLCVPCHKKYDKDSIGAVKRFMGASQF